jgi:hypothetical protein
MWGIYLQAAQILISQCLCPMELIDRTTHYVNYYVLTTESFMNIKSDKQNLFKPSPTHACKESMIASLAFHCHIKMPKQWTQLQKLHNFGKTMKTYFKSFTQHAPEYFCIS